MKTAAATLAVSLLLSSVSPALAAESAPELTPEQAAILYVRMRGIFVDEADGEFHPENRVNRAEFAAAVTGYLYPSRVNNSCFAALAPSLPPRYTKLFKDVRKDDVIARHLCVGMVTGIVNGDTDGSFRPGMAVTAAEASKMLAQGYGLTYPSLVPTGNPWYFAAMRAMRERDAIASNTPPSAYLTRGQAARMFYALRHQKRFPDFRIIARAPALRDAPVGAEAGGAAQMVASKPLPPLPVLEIRRGDSAATSTDAPSSAEAQAVVRIRRVTSRMSRRTLLETERKRSREARGASLERSISWQLSRATGAEV